MESAPHNNNKEDVFEGEVSPSRSTQSEGVEPIHINIPHKNDAPLDIKDGVLDVTDGEPVLDMTGE